MFIHKNQLRHLLRPQHYFSAEQHDTELLRLFRPTWHLVGTIHDMPRPGDFRTLELLGEPLLLHNFDGEYCAFLNVCPHRHCEITSAARGCMPNPRCQYHGWEYDREGRTGRIPDAGCFRPFDRENARLRKFRVATCGELIFVSLAPEGPSLQEFFGPLWDYWRASFSPPYSYSCCWEQDFPCNWKVVLENSLESYHVPLVHSKTFGVMPKEDNCWHVLEERYTTFRTKAEDNFVNRNMNWLVRRLGAPVTAYYEHQNVHPHLTCSALDVFRLAMAVYPLSPTTCRFKAWSFTLHGPRRGPVAWPVAKVLRRLVDAVAKKVYAEDGAIYAAIQRGLEASPHPGVIGTREERVYVFQEFVLRGCGGEAGNGTARTALPVAEGEPSASAAGFTPTRRLAPTVGPDPRKSR
jgi:phenylpropionate dioxygenase-like ring-hydroxylating dioxygenase large terminal subunit